MATTTSPTTTPGAAPPVPAGLSSRNRRQRRWSLALVGVLLILGSGLAFVLLYVNAGDRAPVLAVARNVPAGQSISASDLDVVRVGADAGVGTISEARRSEVIGQTAAVDLIPGTLIVDEHLGDPVSLAPGEAIVGVDLVGGERAVPRLEEGDVVLVILTSSPAAVNADEDDDDIEFGRVITEATVRVAVISENDEDRMVLSLVVPEDTATEIAGANALDRIAIALLPAP